MEEGAEDSGLGVGTWGLLKEITGYPKPRFRV